MSVTARYIVLLLCSVIVGGCTSSGSGFFGKNEGAFDIATDASTQQITASVESPPSPSEASDKEAIKRAVLAAGNETGSLALAWANEKTGSSGTITAIEEAVTQEGRKCYRFLTTLETYTGISLYDAETCELTAGKWVMSLFRSKQAA